MKALSVGARGQLGLLPLCKTGSCETAVRWEGSIVDPQNAQ